MKSHAPTGARNDRGVSLTLFVMLSFAALILIAGLVIDGGQKITATRRAESVAAAAARAGTDAGSTASLGGQDPGARAVRSARAVLRDSPGVTGTVAVIDGRVVVTTEVRSATIFLSVIGISSLVGTGLAEGELKGP